MWRPNAQMEVVIRKLSASFLFFFFAPPPRPCSPATSISRVGEETGRRKSIIEEGVFFMIMSKSSLFHSGG